MSLSLYFIHLRPFYDQTIFYNSRIIIYKNYIFVIAILRILILKSAKFILVVFMGVLDIFRYTPKVPGYTGSKIAKK